MFHCGQVVKLRSGGASMTIEEVEGNQVGCVWQNNGETKRESFAAVLLNDASAGSLPRLAMAERVLE